MALLVVVVVTVVAASFTAGVHPIASALSSVFGTGHKKGKSCASSWCGLRVGMVYVVTTMGVDGSVFRWDGPMRAVVGTGTKALV